MRSCNSCHARSLQLAPFETTRVPLPPSLRRRRRSRRGPVRVHQRGASVGQVASAIRNPVSTAAAGAVVGSVAAVGATSKLVVWMLALYYYLIVWPLWLVAQLCVIVYWDVPRWAWRSFTQTTGRTPAAAVADAGQQWAARRRAGTASEPVTEFIPVIPAQGAPAAMPPGWYPDAAGAVRWWDGRAWTEQVAPPRTPASIVRYACQTPAHAKC